MKLQTNATMILSMVVCAVAITPEMSAASEPRIDYNVTANSKIVSFEVGDRLFDIPLNHIWSKDNWSGGKTTGVNLHALLPDLSPYSEETRSQFEERGWNRKITILISEYAMPATPTSMTRKEVFERIISKRRKNRTGEKHGLKTFVLEGKNESKRELHVGKTDQGEFFYLQCNLDESVRSPSCSTTLAYSDHVYVRYTYSKKYLPDWMETEQKVLKLIAKWDATD